MTTATQKSPRLLRRQVMIPVATGCLGAGIASRWLSTSVQCQDLAVDGTTPAIRLYQYYTCPFCCKARAFLDYYGYNYETVDVNPLFKKETKFSPEYRKVPILLVDDLQINDSSVIISALRTQAVHNNATPLEEILRYFPILESTDEKGKVVKEHQNKYRIMYADKGMKMMSKEQIIEEAKWRLWVDDRFVHMLSPNIYRTMRESFQAFEYIAREGNFNKVETVLAQKIGAIAMYVIGKVIKKKHRLKDDVRESFYEEARIWTKAIGKKRKFMGGDKPNLADLNVYGVISAIEGLDAFNDLMENTNIGPWYTRMRELVKSHAGRDPETGRFVDVKVVD